MAQMRRFSKQVLDPSIHCTIADNRNNRSVVYTNSEWLRRRCGVQAKHGQAELEQ
jgi:hypothetical protein